MLIHDCGWGQRGNKAARLRSDLLDWILTQISTETEQRDAICLLDKLSAIAGADCGYTENPQIETEVCADIVSRQQKGIAKYGVTVAESPLPLRQWLQHAYEECLDQAIYLKRAMADLEKPSTEGEL